MGATDSGPADAESDAVRSPEKSDVVDVGDWFIGRLNHAKFG
jgi:hypothetical protein